MSRPQRSVFSPIRINAGYRYRGGRGDDVSNLHHNHSPSESALPSGRRGRGRGRDRRYGEPSAHHGASESALPSGNLNAGEPSAHHVASESALSSGNLNAGSKKNWASISFGIKDEGYFRRNKRKKINQITELTTEGLDRPIFLSKILNFANKANNNSLQGIIKGWGNKLTGMLDTVISQVGNEYTFSEEKGSREISVIFNALSKIDDKGKRVKEFYDKIGSEKWQEILEGANSQSIANIFNALSKIDDEGERVKKFHDKIALAKWQEILKGANAQEISNIFNALSKIDDKGKRVKEFYNKIGSEKWQEIIKSANIQNISNIFNASKIDDKGKMVKEFYDKIGSEKWQEILEGANSQSIANIFNALSKIDDKGEKVKEFHDKIALAKWQEILKGANAQEISNIFNALSKFDDKGRVKEFYDKIGSEKWQEIIKSANIQNISNIFNALSKIDDSGKSVKEFHDKIITPERLYGMLRESNESELVTIIENLANTEKGAEKLEGIYQNVFSEKRSKKIIEDKDSRNIGHILVSFCKSPEAKTIIMSLLENEGWMGKKFEKSHCSHKDFINISKIMRALDEVKNGNKELVETFYEKTKHNYTKTGDELKQSYSNINEGNATLLDLHGFTYEGAEIVIKTFLDNMGKNSNPFYIECGKGTHSSGENKNNKMNEILKKALEEKEFNSVSAVGNESYFKIEKLSIAPSTSANLGSGKALATNNTQGVSGKG